jgi:antitoxin component YwqK of YwqJK toxin-antitoxin module
MRYVLTILFLLGVHASYGQTIRFQFKRVNSCNQEGTIDSSGYFLTDEKGSAYNNLDGSVILPRPGKYKIVMWSEPGTKFPEIEITDQELFTYTYHEPKIVVRSYGMHPITVYETCDKPIEGYQEDFYPNGHFRIRGNFQNGRPKDSIVTFYSNGAVERRLTYFPKNILTQEYDSLNNLTKVSRNKRSYYLTDYVSIEYYRDGKVKLKESRLKRLVTVEEYYSSGQLKTLQTKKYRKEYYQNGKLSVEYKSKRKRVKEIKGEYRFEFKIFKTAYDFVGNKTEYAVYENWRMLQPQPYFEIRRSDWIDKWYKYENGKNTLIAKSISTKDFFKANSDQ